MKTEKLEYEVLTCDGEPTGAYVTESGRGYAQQNGFKVRPIKPLNVKIDVPAPMLVPVRGGAFLATVDPEYVLRKGDLWMNLKTTDLRDATFETLTGTDTTHCSMPQEFGAIVDSAGQRLGSFKRFITTSIVMTPMKREELDCRLCMRFVK